MNVKALRRAITTLDPGDIETGFTWVFRLADGTEITGWCDPDNTNNEDGVVLVMNDADGTIANLMVEVAAIVAVYVAFDGIARLGTKNLEG